ncbi:MAG: hypothetical protein ACFFCS_00980 [Candidatus Hodarchaeota archaeon]
MRATLEPRKSVRLNWFKQLKVPFTIKREIKISYDLYSVLNNERVPSVYMHYVFSGLTNPIPSTSIIVFDKELPQSYTSTTGSVGGKINTENMLDSDLNVVDRIVKVEQGEEKITTKPPAPHETHLYKEIQIHERKDTVKRKITLKNETDRAINHLELTIIENKEVRFVESNPPPDNSDPPEYKYSLEVPKDGTVAIEFTLETYQKSTYPIDKPKPVDVR